MPRKRDALISYYNKLDTVVVELNEINKSLKSIETEILYKKVKMPDAK